MYPSRALTIMLDNQLQSCERQITILCSYHPSAEEKRLNERLLKMYQRDGLLKSDSVHLLSELHIEAHLVSSWNLAYHTVGKCCI